MKYIVLVLAFLASFAWINANANSTSSYCVSSREGQFLTLINDYRADNGLAPLAMNQSLGAAAEHHSLDMARNDYFSHTLFNGTTWRQNMRNHGYTYTTYTAENIAAHSSDAQGALNQWKSSPGHNATMLNANYKVIGVGLAYDATSTYGYYWTTTFGGYNDGYAAVYC